jgi:CheY-like chemotaxis protein
VTKVLIVDDEPALTRGLMRAILHRRPDYAVLTASGGAEAVSLLEEQHIDVVITDLRMNEMDGFELLAWLVSQRPHVFALAMSGYADEDTDQRLRALGALECFRKPVDIDALVGRMNEGLARHMRGHVHNVGLASFLQLVELEKKTCTLEVRSTDEVGKLYLRAGELVDAATGALSGEQAACAIIGWPQVSIAIDSGCSTTLRTIERSVHYLVMEAMRVRDESLRAPMAETVPEDAPSSWGPIFTSALPQTAAPKAHPSCTLDSFRLPAGALMLAVVDGDTGTVLLGTEREEMAALAHSAWQLLRRERSLLEGENVEEVATLSATRGELIKPMPELDSFALLVFDAEKTNLVMARLELESFVLQYGSA